MARTTEDEPNNPTELFHQQIVAKAKGIFDRHFPDQDDITRALGAKRVGNYQSFWSIIYLKLIDMRLTAEWEDLLRKAGFEISAENYLLGFKKLTTLASYKKGFMTRYALSIFGPVPPHMQQHVEQLGTIPFEASHALRISDSSPDQQKGPSDIGFRQAIINLDTGACDIQLNSREVLGSIFTGQIPKSEIHPLEKRLELLDHLLDSVSNALDSGAQAIKCQSVGFGYRQQFNF